MSNKSKYEGLPGIVLDQPDVYETNDLPEVDQVKRAVEPDRSENVKILDIKPGDAFNSFVNKDFDGGEVDFRDPLIVQKHQRHGVYESTSRHDDETTQQKYDRLISEVTELTNILACRKEANGFANVLDSKGMIEKLKIVENGLKVVSLGDSSSVDIMAGAQHTVDQLKQMHDGLLATPEKKNVENTVTNKDSSVLYQLYCKPERAKQELMRLNAMEQRIKKIELLIGNDEQKMISLNTLSGSSNLLEAISTISSRVMHLDADTLEGLDARLTSLLYKLNQMTEKKAQLDESQQQKRINDLYDRVMETKLNNAALSEVALRVSSLQDIHEQASQFAATLSFLDAMQNQTESDLKSSAEELKALNQSVSSNLEEFSQHMKAMSDRIDKLK